MIVYTLYTLLKSRSTHPSPIFSHHSVPSSKFGSHDDACIVAPLACKRASVTLLESPVSHTLHHFLRAQTHEDQEPPRRAGRRPQTDGHDDDGQGEAIRGYACSLVVVNINISPGLAFPIAVFAFDRAVCQITCTVARVATPFLLKFHRIFCSHDGVVVALWRLRDEGLAVRGERLQATFSRHSRFRDVA